jgi:urease accessory protein
LLFFESLAPGRVASGESFAYTELEWATDVRCDTVLVARERYRLTPEGEAVRTLRSAFRMRIMRAVL